MIYARTGSILLKETDSPLPKIKVPALFIPQLEHVTQERQKRLQQSDPEGGAESLPETHLSREFTQENGQSAPEWIHRAIANMSRKYPHDRFEPVSRMGKYNIMEHKIICLDCPGTCFKKPSRFNRKTISNGIRTNHF